MYFAAEAARRPRRSRRPSHSVPEVPISETRLSVWEERDRAHVALLNTKNDATIIEWWDEAVAEAIQDGFLDPRKLHQSAYDYAIHVGLIQRPGGARENPVGRKPREEHKGSFHLVFLPVNQAWAIFMGPDQEPNKWSRIAGPAPYSEMKAKWDYMHVSSLNGAGARENPVVEARRRGITDVTHWSLDAAGQVYGNALGKYIRTSAIARVGNRSFDPKNYKYAHFEDVKPGDIVTTVSGSRYRLKGPPEGNPNAPPVGRESSEIPEPHKTNLPWGGMGWVVNLDFIHQGLRAYGTTKKQAAAGAKRDYEAWKARGHQWVVGARENPVEARDFDKAQDALQAAKKFGATHWAWTYWMSEPTLTAFGPSKGRKTVYFERHAFFEQGRWHWPKKNSSDRVRQLPGDARRIPDKAVPIEGVPGWAHEASECGCEHGCGAAEDVPRLDSPDFPHKKHRYRDTTIIEWNDRGRNRFYVEDYSSVNRGTYHHSLESAKKFVDGYFRSEGHGPDQKGGARENPVDENNIPWVKVERDPKVHEEMIELQNKIGPIKGAKEAYKLLYPWTSKQNQENLVIILLDIHAELIGVALIHKGERDRVAVDPGDCLKPAIERGAKGIIMSHNHPSGRADYSDADADLTEAMKEACEVQSIAFIDHIVMGTKEYYSFTDRKLTKLK